MKIICFSVLPVEKPYIEDWAQKNQVEVKILSEDLTSETVDQVKGYDGVSSEGIAPVGEDVYATLEKNGIHQLAIRQVGYDNQDLAAAKKHGIVLTNVAAYSPRAIADMGVTHALYLLRNVGLYQQRMAAGDFTFDEQTISTEIFNCTVGLIGAGHIGGASAQIYSALGARVLTYDPFYDASLEPFTTYVDLDTILTEADIISLHTPLLPSTKHIIDAAALHKMKPNALLINMARGDLVDTAALIAALKNKEIAGAGLDTLADEGEFFGEQQDLSTLPQDYQELQALPNVLITPHVAFFTKLAVKNSMEIALNDAKNLINGGSSRNIIH